MKIAWFLLFVALGGMAYQNYQKVDAAQKELAEANRRLQELQPKADSADQLTQQLASAQQQVAAAEKRVAVFQQLAARQQGFGPNGNAAMAASTSNTTPRPALSGTALDQPSQPTSSRVVPPAPRHR